MNKDQALTRYSAATKLRWNSPVSQWRAAFPTIDSLLKFRLDVGELAWPGSYGDCPWDDAFSLAFHLANGVSGSTREYMQSKADSRWMQDQMAIYAEYGISL